jgi:hypothetical protein
MMNEDVDKIYKDILHNYAIMFRYLNYAIIQSYEKRNKDMEHS